MQLHLCMWVVATLSQHPSLTAPHLSSNDLCLGAMFVFFTVKTKLELAASFQASLELSNHFNVLKCFVGNVEVS